MVGLLVGLAKRVRTRLGRRDYLHEKYTDWTRVFELVADSGLSRSVATMDVTPSIIVRRDFQGGTNYSYTAGWFFSQVDAEDFVKCLTGGGTWVMERLPSFSAVLSNKASVAVLRTGTAGARHDSS